MTKGYSHDGLPQLLGYKISEGQGEILMTHGGSTLNKWEIKLNSKESKMSFIMAMLRQVM